MPRRLPLGLLASALIALSGTPARGGTAQPPCFSPLEVSFSPGGRWLAASDPTAGAVHLIDVIEAVEVAGAIGVESRGAVRRVPLRGKPMGVAWIDGERALVAEYDAGSLAEVDAPSAAVVRRLPAGPKPAGVAVARRRGLAVVCEHGLGEILLVDLARGAVRARVPAGRQPSFAAVTPDETLAVACNLLPLGPATRASTAASLTLVRLEDGARVAEIELPDGAANARGIAVAPGGRWAYCAHTQGRVLAPTTQLDRGWVNTNALSLIDLERATVRGTAFLDSVTEGAADPWGVALSPRGDVAWVALAGVHQVARADLERLRGVLAARQPVEGNGAGPEPGAAAPAAVAVPAAVRPRRELLDSPGLRPPVARKGDRLASPLTATFAGTAVERFSLPGRGPRGVAVAPGGDLVAVAAYFSGAVLLLDSRTAEVRRTVALGPEPQPDLARRGEMLFHDGTLSYEHWLSCSTCHPGGRADGLNWDLINDGIGNPKNTRSLLLAHRTPPVMSLGVRPSYEVAVAKGFQFILFNPGTAEEREAVAAYIRSLAPEPSPYLAPGGGLSELAQAGKRMFEDPNVGCLRCHPPPLFTDLKRHDVGTKGVLDRSSRFDVPLLGELWRTGPYLHDGSAVTLRQVLTERNGEGRHGRTAHLSAEEIDALVAYLLSL